MWQLLDPLLPLFVLSPSSLVSFFYSWPCLHSGLLPRFCPCTCLLSTHSPWQSWPILYSQVPDIYDSWFLSLVQTLLLNLSFVFLGLCASQLSLVAKNPPASAGDIRDSGFDPWRHEDPLEEGVATHTSILAWEIPWIGDLGGLQSIRSQRARQCPKQLSNRPLY